MPTPPQILVVMGVAGSGKSTVGELLARELGWRFADADDFHPPANVAKMSAGTPLTDADRAPWLAALAAMLRESLARGERVVLACSALKARYRDVLAVAPEATRFVHLTGAPEVIAARIAARIGHFMKPEMLASQLAALEPPADALVLDVRATPESLVAEIVSRFAPVR